MMLAALIGLGWAGVHYYRRIRRRTQALMQLLEHADHLERDLRECRERLERAHSMMAVAPGVPASGEPDARAAVDAGLRSLLEHRLWIRDHAEDATQLELDRAVDALTQARNQLEPQLKALDQAQRELDQAVLDRLDRGNPA
ncbi:hypothetical protein HBF24_06445 [Oleiagrimonas sp. C23AA]|nr:hypothetical protein [Oleiagrimonas sp. C23AA]